MCKKCEMRDIKMSLVPLDLGSIKQGVELPKPWPGLVAMNFYPDLIDRAYAHTGWSMRNNDPVVTSNARAVLSSIGKGFLESFNRNTFNPSPNDENRSLKIRALDAIDSLSEEFGDRVSSVMWNSLAHLATRERPLENRSILKEKDSLPHHFGIVDTMLHALGKVYTFSLRVQSVFFEHTGHVLIHNCDCNCSLLNMSPVRGTIHFDRLSNQQILEATQSLFTHQLAESHLILDRTLPFGYSITEEGILLLGK